MILYRHILRAHLMPFVGSFLFIMLVFILQFVMKFMDQLVGKGLSGAVIIELVALNLAWMVVLAVPMAVLIAALMGFGNLASSSEVTAMKAGGMSLLRMIAPVLVASLVVAYLLVEFNNKVLPEANHRLKTLLIDIRRKKPTLTLVPGLFSQDLPGYSILVRKTFAQSNDLEGVTIYDFTDPQKNVTISATRGTISFSSDYRLLVMDLYDGEIHEMSNADNANYRIIKFSHQRLATPAAGFDFERSSENAFSRGDRELGAAAMIYIVDSLRHQETAILDHYRLLTKGFDEKLLRGTVPASSRSYPSLQPLLQYPNATSQLMMVRNMTDADAMNLDYTDRTIKEYLVEIHKKYSIPVACIVFILIGAPLGVMTRRGGFGVAASLSLGFFLLYWASLIGGEKLADREIIEPWLGMWVANIAIGLLGLLLTWRVARENVELRLDGWKKLVPRRYRELLWPAS